MLIPIQLYECSVYKCILFVSYKNFLGKKGSMRLYISSVNILNYRYIKPGPEVIKLFSCSTQLSMKFFLLINVKMPTIVGILTFMSGKNSTLVLSEPKRSSLS